MSDLPQPADGEAGGEFPETSRPPADSLQPIDHRALSKRPELASELSSSADRAATGSGIGLAGFLHAYRRHWFLATSLGLICGVTVAAAEFLSATTNYTSSALILIASEDQGIVYQDEKAHSNFELYKGTQMQLLTSDFVLIAALRDPKIANLELLKREEDPIRWLSKSLQVDAPGNAEIIRVGLTTPDRNSGAAIVQAVVGAYQTEVVNKELDRRAKRLAELERVYTEQETELRKKRTDLKSLIETLGTSDKGALSIKEQFALQQYSQSRTDLNQLRRELKRIHYALIDNRAKLAAVKAGRVKPATGAEIDNVVSNDPESIKLQQALAALDDDLSETKSLIKEGGGFAKSITDRYARARTSLETQLATRRARLGEHLRNANSGDIDSIEAEAQQLQVQYARLEEEEQQDAKEVELLKKQTDLIGNTSIDVEMMRAELGEMEKTFDAVADEREHARVELNSQARISVVQAASPPTAPDKSARLQNSITGGLFAFLTPIGLLLLWDVRARRINSCHDISDSLGLQVIGSVPHIPDSTFSRMRPNSRRQRQMQICLDHSIDGIAARLCLRRDARNARVVLVSSATRGEGKSTLSIQLAKRLARTGAGTLLVDFDLRKPTLHHVFDAPRGPGLSEFLLGQCELGPIIRSTDIDNLSLLTAGAQFSNSLGTLANGVTRSLFDKVRDRFEFVIVDGSPILPVVDSLLASQHVDSVVLAIRRDVSQVARVQAACDQLEQFGVEEFVAVLTGSNEDLYYYDGDPEHPVLAVDERPKPR
jgi:capsular exopolysaccharide synthesis family protein